VGGFFIQGIWGAGRLCEAEAPPKPTGESTTVTEILL